MPMVKCGKKSCIHQGEGRCSLHYICLDLEKSGDSIRCGSFEEDEEYKDVLTLLGRNPRLSTER